MDPEKTFCLKWNDFQQNIFSTIRNLRLDLDFLDVSLFCNSGKTVKAHKVILSACSNTFRSILKETPGPHPVIVLWDMEARDLSAILDFMYNGQVEIRQEDLESFLAAAGRLQVQGLSGEENGDLKGGSGVMADRTRKRPPDVVRNCKPAKLVRRKSTITSDDRRLEEESSGGSLVVHEKENIVHDVRVKEEEEEEVIHNNHRDVRELPRVPDHTAPAPPPPAVCSPLPHHPPPSRALTSLSLRDNHEDTGQVRALQRDGGLHHGYPAPEIVDYPEDAGYEDYYEEDEAGFNSVQYPIDYSLDNSPGKVGLVGPGGVPAKSVKCPFCDKVLKYRHNLKGHIQNQHGAGEPEAPCPICPDKIFKNSASLRDHMSRKHKGEKQGGMSQQD